MDYWMQEKVDGDYAVFYVKVPDDLSSSNVTMYMHYGKSDAVDSSDGELVFDFFDDFSGSVLDESKWVVRQGDVTVLGDQLVLEGTSGTRGLIDSVEEFSVGKALSASVRWGSTQVGTMHFCSLRKSNDWNDRAGDFYGGTAVNTINYETDNGGIATETLNVHISSPDSAHVYTATWRSGESKGYQDESLKVTHTSNVASVDQCVVFYEGMTVGTYAYVDWCFVRKWVDPEPAHGLWGNEETETMAVTITSAKTVIGKGYTGNIAVTVKNLFSITETFNTTVYANETVIAMFVITLDSEDLATLTFSWSTSGFAYGNYVISALLEPTSGETETGMLSTPVHVGVPGDVSGPTQGVFDGTTNMRDINYIVLLFNSRPDSPSWKPNADVNDDGTVNMRDINIAILNFNKHE
jgi:hypothetical protein